MAYQTTTLNILITTCANRNASAGCCWGWLLPAEVDELCGWLDKHKVKDAVGEVYVDDKMCLMCGWAVDDDADDDDDDDDDDDHETSIHIYTFEIFEYEYFR